MDKSKLTRDYEKFPLKRGERPCRKDLEYLYLLCNYKSTEIAQFFNKCDRVVRNWLYAENLQHTQEQKSQLRKQTNLKKYGVENVMQFPEVQEKIKRTNLKKYGVKSHLSSLEIREKIKQTNIQRYGFNNPAKNKKVQEKIKQTNLKKYGTKCVFNIKEIRKKAKKIFQENKKAILKQRKQTNLIKYGVEEVAQNTQVYNKVKQTNLKKYGVKYSFQSSVIKEKIKQTNLIKYGVDNPIKNHQIQQKVKQTNLTRYGVACSLQNDKIASKAKETSLIKYGVEVPLASKKIQQKIKQTNLRRYGVEYPAQNIKIRQKLSKLISSPEIQQKSYETKKRNHSFNTSNPENLIYERLSEKFGEVLRQYKSEKYPFSCDFYIPEIDLYIEFQGNWTHGKEPYNPENPEHQEILKFWQEKAKTSKFYQNAIKTWTISDPEKRTVAREHKLNWLEIFNLNELKHLYLI